MGLVASATGPRLFRFIAPDKLPGPLAEARAIELARVLD